MRSLWPKRCFDLLLVILFIPIWVPVLAVVALLVRLKLGTPVLFRQKRPGLNVEIFELTKFRTMRDARNADGELLPDSERLTSFGRLLRASSLDELPELINILKGEMSQVGPRPLLIEYLPLYSEVQGRRHDVPPGLTGLAQIKGRNSLDWNEKFAWDVTYVESRSLGLDLKILVLTVWTVFQREGISAQGEATMPKFNGGT